MLSAGVFVQGLANLLLDRQFPPALRAALAAAVIAAMAPGLRLPAEA